MKTQIIQLESHDDAISVKDKMGWGQTPRILLVWPKNSSILSRRIDIILLKRHSNFLGAQLAFVTREANIRHYAGLLEIPVYKSIRKAEKTHWRPPRHKRRRKKNAYVEGIPNLRSRRIDRKDRDSLEELKNLAHPRPLKWLTHPVTRSLLFTLGVLGVLAIAAVLVPSAEITLSPQSEWQQITIPVVANLEENTVDYSGIVPIRRVSVIVEGRGQFSTTGEIYLPSKKASGNVIFTNLTDQEKTVPVGTTVTVNDNDSTRFKILETTVVEAASKSDLIPVEAVEPGSKGNISPNQLNAIEGPLGLDLTVTNPQGIYNGKDQVSPAPSEDDYINLLAETLSRLHNAAEQELKSRLSPEDLFLLADPEDYQIIQEVFTPSEVEPADQLYLILSVDYQAYVVYARDLEDLGRYFLQANLPEGFSPIASSPIRIENQNTPVLKEDGSYYWNMKVSWQIEASIPEEDIIPLLLWQEPATAVEHLVTQYPIEENITLKINPGWWPRLPILPFRLEINSLN